MRKSLMRWIMITITIVVIMCITNINKTLYTVQAKTSGEEASLESVNIRNITLGSTIYGGLTGNEDYEDIIYKFTTSTSGKLNITTTTDFDGLRFTILDSNGEDLLFSSEEFYYNDTLGTGTGFYSYNISAGTYYIQIFTWNGYDENIPTLSYCIKPMFVDAKANEMEPNDTYQQATKLGREGIIRGTFTLTDIKDIYKITISKKCVLYLRYDSSEAVPYDISVLNKNGDEEFRDGYAMDSASYNVTLEKGEYYIVLMPSCYTTGHETGNYTLKYSTRETINTKNVFLSTNTYEYNGKIKNPTIKAIDSLGRILTKGVDYVVTVPSGRKNIGTYAYKITFTGDYKGTATKSFQIKPAKTKVTKLKKKSNGIRVTWKKSSNASGYMIYRRTNDGSYKKIKTIKSRKTCSYLDKGARYRWNRYYYKVVAYKKVAGKTYRSKASKVKSIYRR